jgi:hypothetical protein
MRAGVGIFAQPLEPLTPRQRHIVVGLAVIIALTRWLALSRTMWDWDEALFTLGVRDYDVPSHHPHPPGYPLFMLAAKIVRVVLRDDFRAVQGVVFVAALLLFPALFALARELRFPFPVAAGGAALYAFFPNVWYYGGTALSDIPSVVLAAIASALLLRGCREHRAYLFGALLLGVAAGVRPQNLLVGCAPALLATWHAVRRRAWGDVAAAVAIGGAVVAASIAGAALASSSWRGYFEICAMQSRYVRAVDSVFNPTRPSLVSLASGIFVHPMRAGRFDLLLSALAAAGLLVALRHAGALVAVAMFLPMQIFTWLMLDISNTSRYAVAYLPLYAFFVAVTLSLLRGFGTIVVVGIVARLIVWTLPALNEVRRTESPVAAAMAALRRLPPGETIYAHAGVRPFASAMLPDRHVVFVEKESELPLSAAPYVREGAAFAPGARTFRRSRRGHLATFVRAHYFETTIVRAVDAAVFRDGWYDEENDGVNSWRWMSGRASMALPPVGPRARLTLRFTIPTALVAEAPLLTLQLNGQVIDRLRCTSEKMAKSWDVDAAPAVPNELVLAIAPVFNPSRAHAGDDPRDLGLQLLAYDWRGR